MSSTVFTYDYLATELAQGRSVASSSCTVYSFFFAVVSGLRLRSGLTQSLFSFHVPFL